MSELRTHTRTSRITEFVEFVNAVCGGHSKKKSYQQSEAETISKLIVNSQMLQN